jgi:hypothetical protein
MVAENRTATYIRELDVFGKKVGFERVSFRYEVASENELRWHVEKFLLDKEAYHVSESGVPLSSRSFL